MSSKPDEVRFIGVNGYEYAFDDDNKVTLAGITISADGIGKLVRDRVVEVCGRIYRAHGARAFTSTRASTAVHEAGHIVVGTVVGEKACHAFIEQSKEYAGKEGGWIGYTEFAAAPDMRTSESMLQVARNLTAGVCAERMFDPDYRQGSSLDEMVMGQVLSILINKGVGGVAEDDEKYWKTNIWDYACSKLRANHVAVVKAANHLFDRRRISGVALHKVIAEIKERKSP